MGLFKHLFAHSQTLLPSLSTELVLAPLLRSNCTIDIFPHAAAHMSGVSPYLLTELTSAPETIKYSTISSRPPATPASRVLHSKCENSSDAPFSNRIFTTSTWP